MSDEVIVGRYRLGTQLGSGGMAEVFRAEVIGEAGFSKPVAIKRVLHTYSNHPDFAQMFVNEARLVSRLSHPNIVSVIDFAKDDRNQLFLVMELVEGCDLMKLMRSGPIPVPLVSHIVGQILKGLGYAHEARDAEGNPLGIVHRDISPHNVLISWRGEVKVGDFGIAKAVSISGMTRPETIKGKLGYLSPEQARGDRLDGRSDLFAVGVVLHEMLTGQRLFGGGTGAEVLARMMHQPIHAPSRFSMEIPEELDRVCMKLLHRQRDERYANAEEAFDDLVASGHISLRGERELAELLEKRALSLRAGAAPISEAPPREEPRLSAVVEGIEPTRVESDPLAPEASLDDQEPQDELPVRVATSELGEIAAQARPRFPFLWLGLAALAASGFLWLARAADPIPAPLDDSKTLPLDEARVTASPAPLPRPPHDAPRLEPASAALYEAGKQALLDKKHRRAAAHFSGCLQAEPSHAGCYRALVRTYGETGQTANAARTARQYLERFPRADDAASMRSAIEAAEASPARPARKKKKARGKLIIGSDPWGHILIGNKRFGSTPQIVSLPAGVHTVVVKNDVHGFRKEKKVKVVAGRSRELFFELKK